MARKRKKSKGSMKPRTERQKSGDRPSGELDASAERQPDASAEEVPEDNGSTIGVDAVIEIDEELDDPQARERLIAEVAGVGPNGRAADSGDRAADGSHAKRSSGAQASSADEKAPEGDDEAPGTGSPDADDEAQGTGSPDADDEAARQEVRREDDEAPGAETPGDEAPAAGSAQAARGGAGAEKPPDGGTDGAPSDLSAIGPHTRVALRELRQEGLSSSGEELVLDLGEASTPEDRDRLLAATLAHAEMREAVYRVPAQSRRVHRWKARVATLVLLVAAWVATFPPAFLVPDAPPPLSKADQLQGVRASLLLQSQQIEAFRAREGRLPEDLSQAGAPVPGVRFVKPNNRLYQLIGYTPRGEAVVYDSSAPDAAFGTIGAWWAANEAGS